MFLTKIQFDQSDSISQLNLCTGSQQPPNTLRQDKSRKLNLNAASQRQVQNLDQLASKLAKFKLTVNSHQNVLYQGSQQGSNSF